MMSRTNSFLLGFLLGGLASATATLLTAPTSGKKLRDNIVEQSLEWKEMGDDLLQDAINLKDQIADTSKEGVSLIKNLTKELKLSMEEWKGAIEPHQDNIQEYLEQIELSIKALEEKVDSK